MIQACKSIMRRKRFFGTGRGEGRGLDSATGARRGNQKVGVIPVANFRQIHSAFLHIVVGQLRNS